MNWITTYSHHNGKIGVLLDVKVVNDISCNRVEFIEEFVELCRDIAIHIAATNPTDVAALLNQPFVKNPDQKVIELLNEKSESLRDLIAISRFMRWDTGTSDDDNDPRHDPALAMQVKSA